MLTAKQIADQSDEYADLIEEFEIKRLEWTLLQQKMLVEFGETEDTDFRAYSVNNAMHKEHSELANEIDALNVSINRIRAIHESAVAAGWAASFERDQIIFGQKATN